MFGVAVRVGNASSVDVADGGNQTMVEVGSGVSVGRGGWVAAIELSGRQAVRSRNPEKRKMLMNRRIK
jgi:hypothetical protein